MRLQFNTETIDSPPINMQDDHVYVKGKLWSHLPFTLTQEINGQVPARDFGIRTLTGDTWRYTRYNDQEISRLDVFLQMFPVLNLMWQHTNASIEASGQPTKTATRTELLKYIGVIVLSTKYEFCNQSDLWSARSKSKYEMTPQFGTLTGMKRGRYDFIYYHLRFSNQPVEQGALNYD
jgi:Transposase IS4